MDALLIGYAVLTSLVFCQVVLLFVNVVLGVISRVAPQVNIFSIGFPITMGIGLASLLFILPLMETPFLATLERMLAQFR